MSKRNLTKPIIVFFQKNKKFPDRTKYGVVDKLKRIIIFYDK